MTNISPNVPNDFLNEEVRSGYTVSAQMKKVWAIEIDMIQELLRICDKYNLKCWASSGTLLGAVRHKGFIPWDDDMDMCLFRKDYDTLLRVAQNEFKDPYLLQTAYTENKFIRRFARLRNIHTTLIQEMDINMSWNMGIFIDIFPLDGVSSVRSSLKTKIKMELLCKLMRNVIYGGIASPRQIVTVLIPKILWGWNNRYMKLFKLYEKIARKVPVEDAEYVTGFAFGMESEKYPRNKHLYDKTLMVDFEYIKLPIPAGYHELLTTIYGDYMTPVQSPPHAFIIDTERSAEEILKELREKEFSRKKRK